MGITFEYHDVFFRGEQYKTFLSFYRLGIGSQIEHLLIFQFSFMFGPVSLHTFSLFFPFYTYLSQIILHDMIFLLM